jgi:maleylpyruvate isomerase
MKERLDSIARAHERLRAAVPALDDDQLRMPAKGLPGWTRGYVLAHLATLATAFAQQADYAVQGKIVDMYDGGRPARTAAIACGAALPAPQALRALEDGLTALEESWARLSPADWDHPVSYRDSTLLATQLCWWREIEIHNVDLDVGYRVEDWKTDLSAHVVTHLLPRLPAPDAFRLTAEDTGRSWRHGWGEEVEVLGRQNSLAAWLAGRDSAVPPTVTGHHGELLELGPWP